MNKGTKKSFSLIEFSIVIIIISIALVIAIMSRTLIIAAKVTKIQNDAKSINTLIEIFTNTFGCLPGDCGVNQLPQSIIDVTPSGCFNLSTSTGIGNADSPGNSSGTTTDASSPLISGFNTEEIDSPAKRTCAFYEMQALESQASSITTASVNIINSFIGINKAMAITGTKKLYFTNNPNLNSHVTTIQSQINTLNNNISTNNIIINNNNTSINSNTTQINTITTQINGNNTQISNYNTNNNTIIAGLNGQVTYTRNNVSCGPTYCNCTNAVTTNDVINISGCMSNCLHCAQCGSPGCGGCSNLCYYSGYLLNKNSVISNNANINTLTTQNNTLTTQNNTLTTQNNTLTTQNNTLTAQNAGYQSQINTLQDPNQYISLSIPTVTNPVLTSFPGAMWDLRTIGAVNQQSNGIYPYEISNNPSSAAFGQWNKKIAIIARSSTNGNDITDAGSASMAALSSEAALRLSLKFGSGFPYVGNIVAGKNYSQMNDSIGCTNATGSAWENVIANYTTTKYSTSNNIQNGCTIAILLNT